MSIAARCGSCRRELPLVQLVQPGQGFRCLFCGFAFAPGYATVAPDVGAQILATHTALVTALAALASMTGGRLRLDQATVVDPVANALPEATATATATATAKEAGLARRGRAHWWARGAGAQPAQQPRPAG